MRTIILSYPNEVVNNAIVDTIKIINHYRLDKEEYDGKNRIWCKDGYLDFSLYLIDPDNSKLELWGKEDLMEQDFEQNLMRVVSGRAVITPEVMNIDPYKQANQTNLLVTILVLIGALIAIIYGFSAFLE